MRSIGFGLERIALAVLARPLLATLAFIFTLAIFGYGVAHLRFDENLRNVFAGDSQAFRDYRASIGEFVDPENEILLLVEGDIGAAGNLARLRDLQFELQFVDGVENVYSLFSLRDPPAAEDVPPPLIGDSVESLDAALATRIRSHPILGSKLLSADGKSALFVITPEVAEAPLAVTNALDTAIGEAATKTLAGSGLTPTVSGFPAIRGGIVEVVRRDAIRLNAIGFFIGFLMSLVVFRSLVGALLTAIPAMLGGFAVIGFMGLAGVPVTIMSNVVPALVMILGYVDSMHLTNAWREHRDLGASVADAERAAQLDVGAACVLAAITTAVAFLSLLIGDIAMVVEFGWVGAVGTMIGSVMVIAAHTLGALAIGRFWRKRSTATQTLLTRLEGPSIALGRMAVRHATAIGVLAVAVFCVFLFLHYSVPPEHSAREHLPRDNPANAALGRIDTAFDGIFPVKIVVPLRGLAPDSPEALARIGAVHKAVAGVPGVGAPLSLWSLAEWLGGDADAGTAAKIGTLLDEFAPETRSRFVGSGAALIGLTVREVPSHEMQPLIVAMEKAAHAAGGDDVIVTGATVLTTRESTDTIENLNLSLTLDVFGNLLIIFIAFRSLPIAGVSFLPNIIPILGVGTFLFFRGSGMQMTSVVALTVAFGIAVDNTIHYVNRFHVLGRRAGPLADRIVETSRTVGPVMVGTTIIIIAGLVTTLSSGLPTIALFGMITAATLAGALFGDLIVLPALMAGFLRRWFDPVPRQNEKAAPARAQA